MCNITGSTSTDYNLRENEMQDYDYFSLFIFFVCGWYLLLKKYVF